MKLALAAVISFVCATATAQTFDGYTCTVDCSGHQAGYDWAERNGIADPSECSGNSESFIEGCQSYAGESGPYGADSELDSDDPYADPDEADE